MKLRSLISHVLLVLFTFSNITAQTRDGWRSVRTNHLFVIGNADPEDLRRVAIWLEFFHSAFARLVSRNVIDSSVPTTVIVFRDDAAKAIESEYGITLDVLEEEFRAYVRRGSLSAQVITGVANPETYRTYTATQRSSLTDSEAYYYLADLCVHMGRYKVAERGFK
jgi:hypothetical protein